MNADVIFLFHSHALAGIPCLNQLLGPFNRNKGHKKRDWSITPKREHSTFLLQTATEELTSGVSKCMQAQAAGARHGGDASAANFASAATQQLTKEAIQAC
jgi:hypothetical protein